MNRPTAAGPWVPGPPPEECKASGTPVLVWDDDEPTIAFWWQGGFWADDHGAPLDAIAFHARINPPGGGA